jgi:hypothetical protein
VPLHVIVRRLHDASNVCDALIEALDNGASGAQFGFEFGVFDPPRFVAINEGKKLSLWVAG